jgi:hypothetical protein
MNDRPRERDAEIARLLGELADLSAEGDALAACRREADAFDPDACLKSIERALLALEREGAPP